MTDDDKTLGTRQAVLHLGTYKTGSSSLQNLLHANRATLAKLGILYPQSGLVRDPEIGHRHRGLIDPVVTGRVQRYAIEPLCEELAASTPDLVLLSSEAWSVPRHMPMLGGFVTELADMGFDSIQGVAVLRQLTDYKLSHYREFTWRQGNRLAFAAYLRNAPGMFDYLFLVRSWRAIFGDALHVLNYAAVKNTVTAVLEAVDLEDLQYLMPVKVQRSNVRPASPLAIEVMRQANIRSLGRPRGLQLLDHVAEVHADLFAETWTERSAPEAFVYGPGYRRELARLTGWDAEAIDQLLADRPIEGQHVDVAMADIMPTITAWVAAQS